VIGLIWAGIARYMYLCGHAYLAGCASVPLADGPAVWDAIRAKHLAPQQFQVRPHIGMGTDLLAPKATAQIPPLVRGYLRLGAWVCGPPAVDDDFGCADFFVLLPMDRVDQRYLKFFLGSVDASVGEGGGAR
ncbi:MAG: GNAT family N-acetyltransferase, partial [Sciscionella sp.]|nr:GNAT family N-acetyltransferase [Sciscionella sp.]